MVFTNLTWVGPAMPHHPFIWGQGVEGLINVLACLPHGLDLGAKEGFNHRLEGHHVWFYWIYLKNCSSHMRLTVKITKVLGIVNKICFFCYRVLEEFNYKSVPIGNSLCRSNQELQGHVCMRCLMLIRLILGISVPGKKCASMHYISSVGIKHLTKTFICTNAHSASYDKLS